MHQGTDNILSVVLVQLFILNFKVNLHPTMQKLEQYILSHLLARLAWQSWFPHLAWRTLYKYVEDGERKTLNDFGQKIRANGSLALDMNNMFHYVLS